MAASTTDLGALCLSPEATEALIDTKVATAKAEAKAEILAYLQGLTNVDIIAGDGEYIGVRIPLTFSAEDYGRTGYPIGNLLGSTFSKFTNAGFEEGDSSEIIREMFDIKRVTRNAVDGNGDAILDSDGNQIVETFVSCNTVYCKQWMQEVDGVLNVCFAVKATADESHGFKPHAAFIDPLTHDVLAKSLVSAYPLSPVTTQGGSTAYVSISGGLPIDETAPETIEDGKPAGEDRFGPWSHLFALLHIIHTGAWGDAYAATLTSTSEQEWAGTGWDYNGYIIPAADTTNLTFSVLSTSEYANLEVGMTCVLTTNNYSAGRHAILEITSKTTSGSYTVFGYSVVYGDNVSPSGKYLHFHYKGYTGVTDSISGLHGVVTDYPAHFMPFKEFGIENPYGFGTWCDAFGWYYGELVRYVNGKVGCLRDNRNTWERVGVGQAQYGCGWAGALAFAAPTDDGNGVNPYHGILVPTSRLGSSSIGTCSYIEMSDNNDYAFSWGRKGSSMNPNERVAPNGIAFWFSGNSSYAWGGRADNCSVVRCFGRFYRSEIRTN